MQNYNSRTFTIKKDINTLYDLFMNPRSASPLLEKVGDKFPTDKVQLTDTGIEVDAPVVGKVKVERVEAVEPSLIRFRGQGTPVPMMLNINLRPGENAGETLAQVGVDAEVPAFLSGMIGSKVKPALEKLADALDGLDLDQFLKK